MIQSVAVGQRPVGLRHSEGCHGVHGPRGKGKQVDVFLDGVNQCWSLIFKKEPA